MALVPAVRLAALAFLAGAAFAGADTALGPTVSLAGNFSVQGKAVAGGFYSGNYGPFYVRVCAAYSPMPASPTYSQDWPPSSPPTDDRGYASCELLGAHFADGSRALGLGGFYKFSRGRKDYDYYFYGPTIESLQENYVAFKHDIVAVGGCRVHAEGKGTAVVWGGLGVSHFRRHGLRRHWWSDFYNPENTYEVITPLDTQLTTLAAGVGVDVRARFAGPFGAYGSARGVAPLANIYLQGYDRAEPGASIAFTAGGLVGW
ncbi:MAG: hypothetical protein JSU81_05445 [Candidatus Coatesbacteria bacterium]|nr:MAG: hypothetical protein JSU81_05445 [Candidatus Coatesbacteria bacterium]